MEIKFKEKPSVTKLIKETGFKKEFSSKNPYADFVGYLINCSKVARVLAIKTKIYANHKALGHYCEQIWEPIYCISKQLTMEYGDLQGFGNYTISEYENMEPSAYFESAKTYIEGIRDGLLKDADHTVTSEINKILKITNNTLYHLKMS